MSLSHLDHRLKKSRALKPDSQSCIWSTAFSLSSRPGHRCAWMASTYSWSSYVYIEIIPIMHGRNTFENPGEIHFSPHVHKRLKSALQVQVQLNYGLQPKTGFVKFDKWISPSCYMDLSNSHPCAQTPRISSASASSAVMYYGLEPKTSKIIARHIIVEW